MGVFVYYLFRVCYFELFQNIYYKIRISKPFGFIISDKKFDFPQLIDGAQSFRWMDVEKLYADELTLPIDKKVVDMLRYM